jgi:putative ABC transport system permease protein
MQTLWQDLHYGARMLLKQPGFTLIAVLALALGIGANTAIFSVVNAVLLRPLPYPNAERLRLIWGRLPGHGLERLNVSAPEFADYRKRTQSFAEVSVYGQTGFNFTGRGEPERLTGALTSANLFPSLGVAPSLGRNFLPEEDRDGREQVVILSYGLWQRRFGGDPQLIGQSLTLNGKSHVVVGVMPPGFQFPAQEVELWRPIAFSAADLGADERGNHWLSALGLLKPGVTETQAQREIDGLARQMQWEHPQNYDDPGWGIALVTLREQLVGETRWALLVLLGAVGCVLLLACANVANLLLARAAARRREMAVRLALGAGRLRLIRQLLTESLWLALGGGALGVLLAFWGSDWLNALSPADLPRVGKIGLDRRVLLFTGAVSLLTGLLFGLVPAWQASRPALNEVLKEGGRGATDGRGRLRHLLIVGEIAITLVLLVGAGLLLKSLYRLQQVDPGFDPTNVLTLRLALPRSNYPEPSRQRAFFEQLLARLKTLPGIQAAGAVHNLPLSSGNTRNFAVEGQSEVKLNLEFYQASPDFFRAMGMRLQAGRYFDERDRADAPFVAVVNETMARLFFANTDPLGKRLKLGTLAGPFPWLTIVGIVKDVKHDGLEAATRPELFVPYLQAPLPDWTVPPMYLVVRTTADAQGQLAAVRGAVRELDKDQPIHNENTLEQLLARSQAARRFNLLLLTLFALTALALAAIGLYGVMAYAVTQRRHELGIRIALGAQTSDVLRLVIGQGLRLTFIGVLCGAGGALVLTRLLKSLLFGVSATDSLTYIVIALLLTAVALVACWIPARRAAKVDPLVALRTE